MTDVQLSPPRRSTPEPLPANIRSVQPGGGFCYQIELSWGRLRRTYLKIFRRGYVQRMARLRHGNHLGAPHEVLDPRDLKYCRNQCSCYWEPANDSFRWREKIPLARWGLAEVQLMGYPLIAATIAAWWFGAWYYAIVPVTLALLVISFFRDPPRRVPEAAGLVVAPADGKVVEIKQLDHDEWVGGPAVRISIFLTLFNVHVNRAPLRGRVLAMRYTPGKFISAARPESSLVNECMWIGLEDDGPTMRRFWVRQISGLVARRIVCDLKPGDVLERGQKFGMIKLGSRTELVLPASDDLEIVARVGEWIAAGRDVIARWNKNGAIQGAEQ